jgi:cytoskeletal protein CcmA (bactofilin family)
MWNNKNSSDSSGQSSGTGVDTLPEPARTAVAAPVKPKPYPYTNDSAARVPSWLGPELNIKGQISGAEDLQVECTVDGPISLRDHRLTIGPNAHVQSELVASEIVVHGDVSGDLLASDRIEIKKNSSVVGNLTTARIMIEEGAYFKGAVEISRKTPPDLNLDTLLARPEKKTM